MPGCCQLDWRARERCSSQRRISHYGREGTKSTRVRTRLLTGKGGPEQEGVRLSTVRVDPGACPIPPGKLRFFLRIKIAEDARRFNQLPA